MKKIECDVVVVGAGNAAFSAAMSAQEHGNKVVMLEKASEEEFGGNSRFTAGAMRVVYDGVEDIKALVPDLTEEEIENTDFGQYTEEHYFDDMGRITEYRTDPDMCETLVTRSRETLRWMRDKGIRFACIYGRQAFKVDGKFKFWGGLTVESWGGGPGLIEGWQRIAKENDVDLIFDAKALRLIHDDDGVHGVIAKINGKSTEIRAKSVVLAAGGFQANHEMRTRYMGPGWDLAKVRGTRHNTGDGIRMALEVGARPFGNWSGAHAVQWEMNAPEYGDLAVGDNFQKHSYPWSVMINARGQRFVDEGADFRNYTYAKYGSVVLQQPGQFAWQVFDQQVASQIRDEYRIKQVTKVTGKTLEELGERMEGVDKDGFVKEMAAYNAAVQKDIPFNPTIKDGRCTKGLPINKTNWAMTVEEGPFEAYQVTCGITFTFGGVQINEDGQVIDTEEVPIKGLYAAGEMVGGLFYFNYPGGTGLTAGSVFGRIAGNGAGKAAAQGN
jgi:tricarballylate dehydrogenase